MLKLFDSILTRNEQKIFGFLAVVLIGGMLAYYSGVSSIYAEKTSEEQTMVQSVVSKDSLFKVDIRTAVKDELMLLSGIGEKRAEDILAYRAKKQFASTQEILNISGIGARTYLKMLPMLAQFGSYGDGVESKAKLEAIKLEQSISAENLKQELDETANSPKSDTINKTEISADKKQIILLNSADKEQLMLLDGIGEVKAQAILDYRRQIGKFSSVEQLLEVKGIGPKTLEKNRHRLGL